MYLQVQLYSTWQFKFDCQDISNFIAQRVINKYLSKEDDEILVKSNSGRSKLLECQQIQARRVMNRILAKSYQLHTN